MSALSTTWTAWSSPGSPSSIALIDWTKPSTGLPPMSSVNESTVTASDARLARYRNAPSALATTDWTPLRKSTGSAPSVSPADSVVWVSSSPVIASRVNTESESSSTLAPTSQLPGVPGTSASPLTPSSESKGPVVGSSGSRLR